MSISREGIVSFLNRHFDIDTTDFNDDTLLFSEGRLDSLSLADLLVFLEEKGEFSIAPQEVTLENLDSIGRILAFVETKNS